MSVPELHVGISLRLKLRVFLACMLCGWCLPAFSAQPETECKPGISSSTNDSFAETPLPVRHGPQVRTSRAVPHVQIGVKPNKQINATLFKLAFALPGLESHPTIVSLPGAIGMWLEKSVPVAQPKAIVRGREFAHIHTDGSLHTPLPLTRALELESKGWGERHPWADRNEGWEGLVMLYSANTNEELETLIQLITESYNYVTGRTSPIPSC